MSGLLNLKRGTADSSDASQVLEVASTDGAISIPDRGKKFVFVTKGSAAALTLAAPSTAQNGVEIDIISTTAFAHTITAATIGFNDGGTASDVCTFSAAKGNRLCVVAYAGDWWVMDNINGTLA